MFHWNEMLNWWLPGCMITYMFSIKLAMIVQAYKNIRWEYERPEMWKYIGIISIHPECEGGIEKSITRITNWHHEACQVMTKVDREGWIFLSHPHTNNGFFFLLTTKYLIYIGKTWKRLPEHPEYAEMRHGDVILTLQWCHGSTCGQRVDDMLLLIFYLSLGLVRVCEIEISHMGKNNGNPYLVCENTLSAVDLNKKGFSRDTCLFAWFLTHINSI